ncbi:MAG: HYC_CC_PP family protein [Bacteroidia bacterium]
MKKPIAILLAFFMLFSSVGFAMNTHFCGGKLVKSSFSLGIHNPDCGMGNLDATCEHKQSKDEKFQSEGCCKNMHQVVEMDDGIELQLDTEKLYPNFLIAFTYAFMASLVLKEEINVCYSEFSPPLPDKDIQVLFQTFLI